MVNLGAKLGTFDVESVGETKKRNVGVATLEGTLPS